jgi:murein tripeptide amidase MpaA
MEIYLTHIVASSPEELRALDVFGLDLKHRAARREAARRFVVPGVLTDDQVRELQQAGYEVEIVEDLSRVAAQRSEDVSRSNRFADARSLGEFEERAVLGYLTTSEIDSALSNLATVHSDILTLITLPHTTWEGRTCYAVRLRAGTLANRPGVLFTGGVHAREWGGSDICLGFLTNLINAYRVKGPLTYGGKTFTAPQVRNVLERCDVFVLPNANPDGKNYSQMFDVSSGSAQQFWWRKNRNPNMSTGGGARGVDVNRNFDFLWPSGIGTSTSPSSNVYRGPAAFSEPESRNIRHLFDTYPSIRYYVDVHSFGELLLYSWGDDDNQSVTPAQNFANPAFNGIRGTPGDTAYREFIPTLDERTAVGLANRMHTALTAVRGKTYTVQQAVGLYPTSATSDDYAFSRSIADALKGKVYAYTFEFSTEFVPPNAEMVNVVRDIAAALTELCVAASSNLYVRDNPSDVGAVPSGGAFWNSPDVWVRNAEDGGTTHQDAIRGQDNFVYVRITNRGQEEAKNVATRLYITSFAGTEFVWPNDWVPRNPSGGGSLGPPGTYLIGETATGAIPPGGSQIVHVRWQAALIPPQTGWHPCLLVEVAPDDGPRAPGAHVWDSNNLAQKNITIVDARRRELVRFPFLVGSEFSRVRRAELVVRKLRAPRTIALYLDVQSPELIESLGAELLPPPIPILPAQPIAEPAPPGAVTATLLGPTTVAVPIGVAEGAGDSFLIRLPAETRVHAPASLIGESLRLRERAQIGGFELVHVGEKPLLSLVGKTGSLKLPSPPRRTPMQVEIPIPDDAAVGDSYAFEIVERDGEQPVGGLVLRVNVVD